MTARVVVYVYAILLAVSYHRIGEPAFPRGGAGGHLESLKNGVKSSQSQVKKIGALALYWARSSHPLHEDSVFPELDASARE
jgi:hypothetical protein